MQLATATATSGAAAEAARLQIQTNSMPFDRARDEFSKLLSLDCGAAAAKAAKTGHKIEMKCNNFETFAGWNQRSRASRSVSDQGSLHSRLPI